MPGILQVSEVWAESLLLLLGGGVVRATVGYRRIPGFVHGLDGTLRVQVPREIGLRSQSPFKV